MIKLVLLISGIVLFAGCAGPDKPVQVEQPVSTPALPAQPTPAVTPPVKENIPRNPYLFFEVYLLPPERITNECPQLWATLTDFPTYSFNESERRLYPQVPPGAYDFIRFNESLIAIAGVGIIGYGGGVSSQLEPVYGLPYSSIGKRVPVPNYWTEMDEFRKVQVISITNGTLSVSFDNQTVRLTPGNSWSRQFRPPCGERIRIENHGYLNLGIETAQSQ